MSSRDSVVRAMTDDGAFRVITARTTDTVRDAARRQSTRGPLTRTFGELLTAAVLYREAMAPQLRVQMLLAGGGASGRLVADSHPTGDNRGLVQARERQPLELASGARLQVMRSLPGGKLHQGIVEVPASGSISEAFMVYMQTSEQVVSTIAVDTRLDDSGEIWSAGGYMVQLLPEAKRGPLMLMTERLEDYRDISRLTAAQDFSPDSLLTELLFGMDFTRLGESPLRFGCWCSETGIMSALSTLPTSDVQEMFDDGEVLEINCDYCGADYRINPERLKGLLASN